MSLKTDLLAKLDEIDTLEQKLQEKKAVLDYLETTIELKRKEAEKIKKEADESVLKAGGLDEIKKSKLTYDEKIEELNKKIIDAKKKEFELIKWENRLVEIQRNQENEDVKLLTGKTELDEEKKTYKEKLKAEFLEALKKQLPQ